MYLSRLILNPRSRQVCREVADAYELHRTISKAFSSEVFHLDRKTPSAPGILFRLEIHPYTGEPTLLVQSRIKPDWSYMSEPGKNYLIPSDELPSEVENPAVKFVDLEFQYGQYLQFRLKANPTVKKDRENKKQGRRIGLYREDEQIKWLTRKMRSAGCELVSVRVSNKERVKGKLFLEKEDEKQLRFLAAQFDGVILVQDPAPLLLALSVGIGSGKGLGFGLLSLAPVQK